MVTHKEPVERVKFQNEIEEVRKALGIDDKYKDEFFKWFTNNYITPKTTKVEIVGDELWITERGDRYNFILGKYDETITQIKLDNVKNAWETIHPQIVKKSSPSKTKFEWPSAVENALEKKGVSKDKIQKIISFISRKYIPLYGKPVNLEFVFSGQHRNIKSEPYLVMERGKVALTTVIEEFETSLRPKKVEKEPAPTQKIPVQKEEIIKSSEPTEVEKEYGYEGLKIVEEKTVEVESVTIKIRGLSVQEGLAERIKEAIKDKPVEEWGRTVPEMVKEAAYNDKRLAERNVSIEIRYKEGENEKTKKISVYTGI